jgi:hypothetical protein
MDADEVPRFGHPSGSGVPPAVLVLDDQGIVTGSSPDAGRVLGHRAEDIVGRPAGDLLAPGSGPPPWTAAGDTWRGDLPVRRPDGRVLRLRGTAHRLTDRDGRTGWLLLASPAAPAPKEADERLRLLNEAGTRIGTTLDVMRTAEELADVAVPVLGDWVCVDLLDTLLRGEEPGPFTGRVALRRVASRSSFTVPPENMHRPGDVDVYPADAPPVRCMATGRPVQSRWRTATSRRRTAVRSRSRTATRRRGSPRTRRGRTGSAGTACARPWPSPCARGA